MAQGKRGQLLEKMIEQTNIVYRKKGLAVVNKIPTPWNVYYDKKTKASRAFPQEKSTVDFIGVSNGRAIAFDAKSTKNKTRLPLSNIRSHQVKYLKQFREQGGIAFLIVGFSKHDEVYFLPIKKLLPWWEGQFKGGRKSIPYDWFKENCHRVVSRNGVILDYLHHCRTKIVRREVHK